MASCENGFCYSLPQFEIWLLVWSRKPYIFCWISSSSLCSLRLDSSSWYKIPDTALTALGWLGMFNFADQLSPLLMAALLVRSFVRSFECSAANFSLVQCLRSLVKCKFGRSVGLSLFGGNGVKVFCCKMSAWHRNGKQFLLQLSRQPY